tara:strand:- start:7663 stop:8418 length:756 start_codon:yes stop_codon:yes gene_type:complete
MTNEVNKYAFGQMTAGAEDNQGEWGTTSDNAWFPEGGRLFPEIFDDALQMPEYSGEALNMILSLAGGGSAAKAVNQATKINNIKNLLKSYLPVAQKMSKDDIMKMATGMSKKPALYSKKEVGMMQKSYLDRLKKADDLAIEMTNKGRMSDAFGRPGSLRSPLAGKYKDIENLRREADIIETELLRNQWVETIGRVPNIKDLGKLKPFPQEIAEQLNPLKPFPQKIAEQLNPNKRLGRAAPFLLPEIEEAGY